MIVFKHTGDFSSTEKFLRRQNRSKYMRTFQEYGKKGVELLSQATPTDTGLTASSWDYEITHRRGRYTLSWSNANVNDGVPIAIIIQYGHATRNGGYVQGRDYINPVMQPIFDSMTEELWREVISE